MAKKVGALVGHGVGCSSVKLRQGRCNENSTLRVLDVGALVGHCVESNCNLVSCTAMIVTHPSERAAEDICTTSHTPTDKHKHYLLSNSHDYMRHHTIETVDNTETH